MEAKMKMIEKYEDLSLSKFNQINDIMQSKLTSEIFDKELRILSVLTDKTVEELENMPMIQIHTLMKRAGFLNEVPTPDKNVVGVILNGKEYITETQIGNWETGRYIDLMSYLQKPLEEQNENLHWIIAICITPKGEKYGDTKLEIIANEVFDYMPITTVMAMSNFFFQLYRALTKITVYYLELLMTEKKMKQPTIPFLVKLIRSTNDGVGLLP